MPDAPSQTFTCPKCGAPQDYKGGTAATIQCPYCETTLIVPEALRTPAPDFGSVSPAEISREAAKLVEIKALLDGGNKIAAIRLYRETFGTGLKEAKDAVEAIERGQSVQIAQVSVGAPGSFQISQGGQEIDITPTASGGIKISRTQSSGCITALIIVIVLFVIGSIALPILLTVGAFTAFVPSVENEPTADSFPAVVPASPTFSPTRIPTVTPTPGFAGVISSFGKKGTAPGALNDARYIAVDNKGNLYVGEYGSARIQRFDTKGEFHDQWTLAPQIPLRGLAADFRGNVYAVQDGKITKFEGITGKNLGTLNYPAGGEGFDDIATTADAGLLATWYEARSGIITSVSGHRDDLVRFDREGKVTQVIKGIVSDQTGDPELDSKVAVDGEGNIYMLAGTFEDAVFKFSPQGKFINRFGSRGNDPGQFNAPNDITTDAKGRVYVSHSNDISVFAPDGRYLDTFGNLDGAAFGMAFDSQDHLWVVTNAGKVYEYGLNK